uniref:exodeoxyribonuclease III n=1 Tax=Amphiprion percula TaxID=161767 RepID=A0A3P8SUV7_AMPPE
MASKLILVLCPLLMLQLISFNACGLRTEVKRADVLKEGRGKIMCLQETKWDEGLVEKVQKEWKGGIYTSNGTGTARGVAILVPEQLKETVKLIYKEKAGRIIIIDFQHNNENYRLINIHCPNIEGERKDFVRGLNKWVTNKTNCLIVGDFNICLTRLDSAKNNTYKNDTSRTELNKLMERNNLIDIWRNLNPFKLQYSRQQGFVQICGFPCHPHSSSSQTLFLLGLFSPLHLVSLHFISSSLYFHFAN